MTGKRRGGSPTTTKKLPFGFPGKEKGEWGPVLARGLKFAEWKQVKRRLRGGAAKINLKKLRKEKAE